MSMTREEAISYLSQIYATTYSERYRDALRIALTALRPVSREQVKKGWKGEWVDKGWDGDFSWQIDGRGNCWKVIECSQCQCKVSVQTNFCPNCGAPMTDEAVEMVIERLGMLYDC